MVQIKIYPSKHNIEIINEARFDSDLNIPLAYVNLDYTKYELEKRIEDDFLKFSANKNIIMTPILPGELIEDTKRFVFNKYEEKTSIETLCKNIRGKQYFTPPYEFIPFKFTYDVTVKKNMKYDVSTDYYINVACFDDSDSLDLSSRLSQVFVYPAERKYVTSNIHFNDDKRNIDALTTMSFDDADFLFLETYDGRYLDSEMTEEVSIDTFLQNNVNVWVGCDIHHHYKYKNDDMGYTTFTSIGAFKEFNLMQPLLSTNTNIQSDVYFNLNRSEYWNQQGKRLHNIFMDRLSPVLIIEHLGKGFEIISHNSVLKEPVKYKNLIYEVMMYVYMLTYKKSKRISEWITFNVPDYEVINNKLYTKSNFVSSRTLDEILNLSFNNYSIYQIDIYDNNDAELPASRDNIVGGTNIECIDVSNNRLVFKLNSSNIYSEVQKPVGWVSIYQDGKIYYVDQIYYYIESDISNKFFVVENENSLLVKLYPFKSSKHNINLTVDLNVTIENIKTDSNGIMRIINEIYIVFLDLNDYSLHYLIDSEYEEQENIIKIAEIDVRQAIDNTFLTDMRQLGGGLSKEAKNDYDLLDIGHIDGRPYRKSNTLIIKMPKKYEQYKDKILAALDKYKVGEDYPVLFFEDEE